MQKEVVWLNYLISNCFLSHGLSYLGIQSLYSSVRIGIDSSLQENVSLFNPSSYIRV